MGATGRLARLALLRRLPWVAVAEIVWVVLQNLAEDIPPKERRRLRELATKSKGDPRKLTPGERDEIRQILSHADVGKVVRAVGARQIPGGKRLLGGRR